jgi:outer membrane receptor protein involved in Fe transport
VYSHDTSGIKTLEAGVQLEKEFSPVYTLACGFRLQLAGYDIARRDILLSDNTEIKSSARLSSSAVKSALYAENIFHISSKLLVNAGLRVDSYSANREVAFSPRLLQIYEPSERTRWKAAWGIYYQSPTYRQLLAAARDDVDVQRMQLAHHITVGVERTLERGIRFRAEWYYKSLQRLISYDRMRSGDLIYSSRNDSRGQINGLECEASFRDERVTGWMNVAWMTAKEVKNAPGARWQPSPTDQRTTLNFVFEPTIAEGWVLSLRSMYGSGFAYATDLPGTRLYERKHYPDYKRVDLRLNYSFETGRVRSTVFIEVTNLFSMRNVQSFQGTLYDFATPDYNLLLPMIINAGVRYEY